MKLNKNYILLLILIVIIIIDEFTSKVNNILTPSLYLILFICIFLQYKSKITTYIFITLIVPTIIITICNAYNIVLNPIVSKIFIILLLIYFIALFINQYRIRLKAD